MPIKSGYRDETTKEFHPVNFYSKALDDIDTDFDRKFAEWDAAQSQLAASTTEPKENDALQVYIQTLQDELDDLSLAAEDFGIVLPVSEIQSLNIFSEYIYQKYFARPDPGLLDP